MNLFFNLVGYLIKIDVTNPESFPTALVASVSAALVAVVVLASSGLLQETQTLDNPIF
jgi:hypothetical protein